MTESKNGSRAKIEAIEKLCEGDADGFMNLSDDLGGVAQSRFVLVSSIRKVLSAGVITPEQVQDAVSDAYQRAHPKPEDWTPLGEVQGGPFDGWVVGTPAYEGAAPPAESGKGYARVSIAKWAKDVPELAELVKAAQQCVTVATVGAPEYDAHDLVEFVLEYLKPALKPFEG